MLSGRDLDLAAQLLASGLSAETVGPYLHHILAPHGVSPRATRAALRLTGRARPLPAASGPAAVAAHRSDAVYRAAYLARAARRLQDGLDTPGVGYTGGLGRERRWVAAHRAATAARTVAASRADRVAAVHGPVLRWVAVLDGRTDPVCRRLHNTRFHVGDPPRVEGWPAFPGGLHAGACRCVAAPAGSGDPGLVAASNLAGSPSSDDPGEDPR